MDSRHYWRKGRDLPTKKGFGQRTQEKQQIRETCRHPNRLNLFILTAERARRSKFLLKERRFPNRRILFGRRFGKRRSLKLQQQLRLPDRSRPGRLVPHFLK